MKILIVTPTFWPATIYGGPAYSVKALAESLSENVENVTLLTTDRNGARWLDVPIGQPVSLGRTQVIYLHQEQGESLGCPAELEAWLERGMAGADLLHVMSTFTMMSFRACRWARSQKVPYVVTTRGHLFSWNWWKDFKKLVALRLFMAKLLHGATRLHATSVMEAERLRSLGFNNVEVVPYGIEVPIDWPEREAAREKWGIRDSDTVILYLGRLHPQKGLELLIRSLGELSQQEIRPILLLAGQGEPDYRKTLETLALHQGVQTQCRFLGPLSGDDKWAFLRCGDLLTHLSSFESFGLAIGEALGAGLPVLIGDRCGWEMVSEMGAGVRVPCQMDAVVLALGNLLTDKAKLRSMGMRGAAWIQSEHVWTSQVRKMVEFYSRALNGSVGKLEGRSVWK